MDMARVEDWLSAIPSKFTRKTYKSGLKKFEQFYEEPVEKLLNLSDEETGHNSEVLCVAQRKRARSEHMQKPNQFSNPIPEIFRQESKIP